MTEEIRADLIGILASSRVFLDSVRAVPEPTSGKKMTATEEKISKARSKAAEAKKDLIMVSLESSLDYPRNEIRWEILKQIWDKRGLEQLAIVTEFETKLEQVFHLVYFGMWISYYLGILNNIDPTPVEVIKFLKDGLAKS